MNVEKSLSRYYLGIAVAIAILMLASAMPVNAQQNSKLDNTAAQSLAFITRYDVKMRFRKQFIAALKNYTVATNRRKSNIMTELYAERDSPVVFWVIERWESEYAYKKMRRAVSYRAVATLAIRALMKPATVIAAIDLEPLPVNEWRKATDSHGEQITIMLFVDAKPGTENKFTNLYHIAMPQFRSEPGVINYQLSQFQDDKTRFVTYEKFRNEAAFQYHLHFAPTNPVIEYLNTSIIKQPFQLGLHRLKLIKTSASIP